MVQATDFKYSTSILRDKNERNFLHKQKHGVVRKTMRSGCWKTDENDEGMINFSHSCVTYVTHFS